MYSARLNPAIEKKTVIKLFDATKRSKRRTPTAMIIEYSINGRVCSRIYFSEEYSTRREVRRTKSLEKVKPGAM